VTGVQTCALPIFISLPILYKMTGFAVYKSVAGNIRLFEFSEGVLLGVLFVKHHEIFKSYYFAFASLSLLVIISLVDFYNPVLKGILLALLIVYVVLFFECVLQFRSKTLEYLGKISYSIYLSHSIVILLVWNFIPIINSQIATMLIFLMIISCTILCSHFTHKLIEVKFSKYLIKLINSRLC